MTPRTLPAETAETAKMADATKKSEFLRHEHIVIGLGLD